MSNYGITVDTGGAAPRAMGNMDITAFWRNAGMMQSALESMKGGVRALRSGIQGAARCFARMGDCAKGVMPAKKYFPEDGRNYLMPIPQPEIDKTEGRVLQNPGYIY